MARNYQKMNKNELIKLLKEKEAALKGADVNKLETNVKSLEAKVTVLEAQNIGLIDSIERFIIKLKYCLETYKLPKKVTLLWLIFNGGLGKIRDLIDCIFTKLSEEEQRIVYQKQIARDPS